VISFGSHKLFEAPIQRAIRRAFKNKASGLSSVKG